MGANNQEPKYVAVTVMVVTPGSLNPFFQPQQTVILSVEQPRAAEVRDDVISQILDAYADLSASSLRSV